MTIKVGRDVFDAVLPATNCSSELSQRMRAAAKEKNLTLGELQRAAFEFFLEFHVNEINPKPQKKRKSKKKGGGNAK